MKTACPLTGVTLLVVDDEPVLSLTMAVLLRREGATVHTAANGAEALALLEQANDVHCMVCDQNMPVMDGRTLLRNLQQRAMSVPTLLLSGVGTCALPDENVREQLSKPVAPAALIAAIRRVVAPGL